MSLRIKVEPESVPPAAADAEPEALADKSPSARVAVGTPGPTPVVQKLADALKPAEVQPELMQPELMQPERSPLSFVMSATEPSSAPRAEASHDMSQFVDGLIAETSPVVEPPAGITMEPVMRSARKRRQWLVGGAITATIVAGSALGVALAADDGAPETSAKSAPLVASHDEPPSSTPAAAVNAVADPSANAATPSDVPSMPTPSASTVTAPTPDDAKPTKTASTKTSTRAKTSTTVKKAGKRTAAKPATTKKAGKKTSTTKRTSKKPAKRTARSR